MTSLEMDTWQLLEKHLEVFVVRFPNYWTGQTREHIV